MIKSQTRLKVLAVLCAILFAAMALTFLTTQTKVAFAEITTVDNGNLSIAGGVLQGFTTEYLEGDYLTADYIHLNVPDTVTEIAANAFKNDAKIVSVTLPSTLTAIGDDAFRECFRLVEVCDNSSLNLVSRPLGYTGDGRIVESALNVFSSTSGSSTLTTDAETKFITCTQNRTESDSHDTYLVGYVGSDAALTLPNGNYKIYRYAFWENSLVTSVDASASSVSEIGAYAFYGCSKLTSVKLPETVKVIGPLAFQNCKELAQCNMPLSLERIEGQAFGGCEKLAGPLSFGSKLAEIGSGAFYGCKSLAGVTFSDPENGASGLVIGRSAFQACNAQTFGVLRLPSKVDLALAAFADTAVQFVYLPADGTYKSDTDSTLFFNNSAKIICPDYETYAICIAATDSIGKHATQMTYQVSVNFDGGDGSVTSVTKLAGESFAYTQNESGAWSEGSDALPLQKGYSRSVWYTDSTFSTKITADDVTAALARVAANKANSLSYAARFVDKSSVNISTVEGLEYNKNLSREAKDFVTGTIPSEVNVAFENGATTVKDAGTYTITVALKSSPIDYGTWAQNIQLDAVISQKVIVLEEAFSWMGLSTGSDDALPLQTDKLLVYTKNGGTETIYSVSYLFGDAMKDYTLSSLISVQNAIFYNRGGEVTVFADIKAEYANDLTVTYTSMKLDGANISDGVRKSSTAGMYEAVAQISANANYILRSSNAVVSGTSLRISNDATTAIAQKEWYLINVSNNLLNAADEDWQISGWTYGSATTDPAAPLLEHETDGTYTAMTFTLVKDAGTTDARTFDGIPYNKFNDYVNTSMPAGTYKLTVHVPQVNGSEIYFPYDSTFEFTVALAVFDASWGTDAKQKLTDIQLQCKESGNDYAMQLYGHKDLSDLAVDLKIWKDFSDDFNPQRKGIWAEKTYDGLYSDRFSLTYHIDGMNTDGYLTYKEVSADSNPVKPNSPDTYIVYYQLEAKNYQSLTDVQSDEKREFFFTITLYKLLDLPDVSGFVFNGNVHTISDTVYYTVETLSDYDYTYAKRQAVMLHSVDGDHYKWQTADGLVTDYEFSFKIGLADNGVEQDLYMAGWQSGAYDAAKTPSWRTTFFDADDENFYTYVLQSQDGTTYTMDKFNTVPVGTYTLVATAKGYVEGDVNTYGYSWKVCTDTATVEVSKASNEWYVLPDVTEWQYKAFDVDTHLILGTPKFEGAGMHFSVTTDAEGSSPIDGLANFSVIDGKVSKEVATILNSLNAGRYYLKVVVEGSDNQEGLSPSPIAFEIHQTRDGWIDFPSITSWNTGKYNAEVNVIVANAVSDKAVKIVIEDVENPQYVIYDSEKGIDLLKTARPGNYKLTASIAEDTNYYELSDVITFRIFEKQGLAWWITVVIVVGALGIVAIVFGILHEKGVLQMISDKVMLNLRTKITVDATIAAVRAQKRAEEVRKAALVERLEKARAEAARQKALPMHEQAALLEEKATLADNKATRLRKRAEKFKAQAEAPVENPEIPQQQNAENKKDEE